MELTLFSCQSCVKGNQVIRKLKFGGWEIGRLEQNMPNLVMFAFGNNSWQGHQNNGQSNNSQNEIENHHNNSSLPFINQRLNAQKINVNIRPVVATTGFNLSIMAGRATEAKATIPVFEQMSESLLSWSLDNLNIRFYYIN